MAQTTQSKLKGIKATAKEIVVSDDNALDAAGIEQIARLMKGNPQLESLTIANCGLTDALAEGLIEPVRNHPSLSKLVLTGNKFSQPKFISSIVAGNDFYRGNQHIRIPGNPRINTVDLSGNEQPLSDKNYLDFLRSLFNADTLTVLKLTGDPWGEKVSNKTSGQLAEMIANAKNIMTLDFGDMKDSRFGLLSQMVSDFDKTKVTFRFKNKVIFDACRRNEAAAKDLLNSIIAGGALDNESAAKVHSRLPAILYLFAQTHGRVIAQRILKDYSLKTAHQLNVSVQYDRFAVPFKEPEKASDMPVAISPEDARNPRFIARALETFVAENVIDQIRAGIDQPLILAELGKDAENVMGKIAVAAMHSALSIPTAESLLQDLSKFIAIFDEAAHIITSIVGKDIRGQFIDVKTELAESDPKPKPGLLGRLFSAPEQPKSLTDAVGGLKDGQKIVDGIFEQMKIIHQSVVAHLDTIYGVVDTCIRIKDQVQQIGETGKAFIDSFMEVNERHGDHSIKPSGMDEEYRISALKNRLGQLKEMETAAEAARDNNNRFAQRIQMHNGKISTLVQQHIPLLVEELADGVRQLAKAGQSFGAAGRTGATPASNFDLNFALQILQNAYEKSKFVQNALTDLGHEAHEMQADFGRNFAPAPASPVAPLPRAPMAQPSAA